MVSVTSHKAAVAALPFGLVVVEQGLPDLPGGELLRWLDSRDECRCPAVLLCDDPSQIAFMPGGECPFSVVLPHAATGPQLLEVLRRVPALESRR